MLVLGGRVDKVVVRRNVQQGDGALSLFWRLGHSILFSTKFVFCFAFLFTEPIQTFQHSPFCNVNGERHFERLP